MTSRKNPASVTKNKSTPQTIPVQSDYHRLLVDIKQRIQTAQLRAALAANAELVLLYWDLGHEILTRQDAEGWGAKVIDRLSKDLTQAFPAMKGFSPRNLKYMRAFAEAWPERPFVQRTVAQLPWRHQIALLDKLKGPTERLFYAQAAVEHGWSRDVLVFQIESSLHQRQGKAVSNFKRTLPDPQSDLAQQALKDPYVFDFLQLTEPLQERELENNLIDHIRAFLLELGVGFAFVGQQYRLSFSDQDFYIDLLFYHLKLRCYVVIELKNTAFKPEHAGQLNFYLTAVDEAMRHPEDKPTIGLLLCKTKNNLVAEYALRNITSPIGVANWRNQLVHSLPEELKSSLPSIEQIEAELAATNNAADK